MFANEDIGCLLAFWATVLGLGVIVATAAVTSLIWWMVT